MSKKIYQDLPADFIRQMENWAWVNAGAGGYESSCVQRIRASKGSGSYTSAPLIANAKAIERALDNLPVRYRQAVSLFWQYPGKPLKWFAQRSGKGVDYRTYERRVLEGHERLRAELAKQAEQVRRCRQDTRRMKVLADSS